MALSPAEKQRRYRERHLGVEGAKERLQCVVSVRAKAQLERLAQHHGYSVTRMIETLAADAERAVLDQLTDPDAKAYLDAQLPCNQRLP